jgi:AraC-like DNA-binding protein
MKYTTRASDNASSNRLQIITARFVSIDNWTHKDLRAPYWRLYWNKDKAAEITRIGQRITLGPERIVLIPPETNFAAVCPQPMQHFYVHFICTSVYRKNEFICLPINKERRSILNYLISIHSELGQEWRLLELVAHCLSSLPRNDWFLAGQRVHLQLKPALDLLEANLPKPTTTARLAAAAGMNTNAFIRQFTGHYGCTPGFYQRQRRIDSACILLHHADVSIDAIAEVCGFCDRHHFSKVFKQIRKLAPAEFRRHKPLSSESSPPSQGAKFQLDWLDGYKHHHY